jgi:hypothetical protein
MRSPGFKIGDAYQFAAEHGLAAEAQKIQSMPIDPRIKKKHVVRKTAFVVLFEKQSVMDAFVSQHWPARHTEAGERRRQSYLDTHLQNERLLRGEIPDEDERDESLPPAPDESPVDADLTAFAMEGQLRDFIIENLGQIQINASRLRLYRNAEGRDGKEYPTDVGQIDILAVDDVGNLFVFELKLDRGPDRALGQLARYMGWVKVHLAAGRDVRGIVVARSIDERLQYAACVIPNVSLLQYEVEFRLHDVGPIAAQPNEALQSTAAAEL